MPPTTKIPLCCLVSVAFIIGNNSNLKCFSFPFALSLLREKNKKKVKKINNLVFDPKICLNIPSGFLQDLPT